MYNFVFHPLSHHWTVHDDRRGCSPRQQAFVLESSIEDLAWPVLEGAEGINPDIFEG